MLPSATSPHAFQKIQKMLCPTSWVLGYIFWKTHRHFLFHDISHWDHMNLLEKTGGGFCSMKLPQLPQGRAGALSQILACTWICLGGGTTLVVERPLNYGSKDPKLI